MMEAAPLKFFHSSFTTIALPGLRAACVLSFVMLDNLQHLRSLRLGSEDSTRPESNQSDFECCKTYSYSGSGKSRKQG